MTNKKRIQRYYNRKHRAKMHHEKARVLKAARVFAYVLGVDFKKVRKKVKQNRKDGQREGNLFTKKSK